MSHSVLRSVGFARLFRRLKPALKRNNLAGRWPEGQLYPTLPEGQLYPILPEGRLCPLPEGRLYPICSSPDASAFPEAAVSESHLQEAAC